MSTEEEGTFKVGDVSLYTKTWTVRILYSPLTPAQSLTPHVL